MDTGQLAIGSVFAGFRIEGLLGTGGMGAVYLVGHPHLPRQVALLVRHTRAPARANRPARVGGGARQTPKGTAPNPPPPQTPNPRF